MPEGYPLAQPVTLWVHSRASDVAKDFAAFVAAHGPQVQESLQANGVVPAPPPKAESGGLRPEGGGQKAKGLGPVALGQFDEDESGERKPSPGTAGKEPMEKATASLPATPPPPAGAPKSTSPAPGPDFPASPYNESSAGDVRLVLGIAMLAAAGAVALVAVRMIRRRNG